MSRLREEVNANLERLDEYLAPPPRLFWKALRAYREYVSELERKLDSQSETEAAVAE